MVLVKKMLQVGTGKSILGFIYPNIEKIFQYPCRQRYKESSYRVKKLVKKVNYFADKRVQQQFTFRTPDGPGNKFSQHQDKKGRCQRFKKKFKQINIGNRCMPVGNQPVPYRQKHFTYQQTIDNKANIKPYQRGA